MQHTVATDVRLNTMTPNTHEHNVVVKILSKRAIVDQTTKDGRHIAHAIFVVADNTGCMNLDARDGTFARAIFFLL